MVCHKHSIIQIRCLADGNTDQLNAVGIAVCHGSLQFRVLKSCHANEKSAMSALFLWVRPAGRTYLEVKVLYSPDKGKS
jgi:hypothetical protein